MFTASFENDESRTLGAEQIYSEFSSFQNQLKNFFSSFYLNPKIRNYHPIHD